MLIVSLFMTLCFVSLSLYHHHLCLLFPASRDFLTAEDKEGVFNADHFPLWYKRAAEQVPGTFVYSLPFNTGELYIFNFQKMMSQFSPQS